MVLEATMIIVDNSEYMRNGDYAPTRFGAQSDAVNIIFGTKTQSNPENTVGVMTMAGKTPEVLVTPTGDIGKVLVALHNLKIGGEADLATGIQIAQLALKHRLNKNQRQRIIVFVGSPLVADEKSLVKLGKKLKKNNVSIDVVSFGEAEENDSRLRTFVDTVSSADNSHLLSIPAGPHLISDAIISSPILAGEDGIPGGIDGDPAGATGGGQNFEFGVDPSLDPELAMALRLSMQEEQARRDAGTSASTAAVEGAGLPTTTPPAPQPSSPTAAGDAPIDEDDEALLAQALALSQGEDVEMADEADLDEAEAIALAIRESAGDEQPPKK
ncbi:hypothetical protein BS47DRAFT_1371038 [Hydnum rufescens UP504]|uniref:VWFA domain-containing protein n=1 Tax=Hydnum rufescens UP504 TaxID=1448309 RepID=A0A9P6B8V7_9AGAM|nr:hypothetical protein BS47DRAFT_1371038 [Hydnum rufescens UP504]